MLELVALGLSNTEVGARLHISGHTVAAHVSSAIRRLGARSRTDLVARSYAQGILDPVEWPPRSLGRRCVRDLPVGATGSQLPALRSPG